MASLFASQPQLVPVPTPDQALVPGQAVQGSKPNRQNETPSFLGAAAAPQGQTNAGGKTLLGQ
jgi:hypothetical protein